MNWDFKDSSHLNDLECLAVGEPWTKSNNSSMALLVEIFYRDKIQLIYGVLWHFLLKHSIE